MAYKKEKYIFRSSGVWEAQDQDDADSVSAEGPFPTSQKVFKWQMGNEAFWGLLNKGTNLMHEGFSLMTYLSPKCPTTKYDHTGD